MDLLNARTWAAKEARSILEYVKNRPIDVPILLKTGYGPSGTPHLGTACEIIRTSMVAKFLREIQPRPVVVISFADNMDGMRKIADNLPNQEMLKKYIGHPLCRIPDPFGLMENFAEYSVSQVGGFLEKLGYGYVDYRPIKEYSTKKLAEISPNGEIVILRSSDFYQNGLFDNLLLQILHKHKEILDVMLPTLGEERRATYCPLMPISPKSGKVLEGGVIEYKQSSIVFKEDGEIFETEVNGKNYKAQWKVDFGMQWIGLNVDYEMYGKDIAIGSTPLSSKICRILGGTPPPGMMYEMFLAADGAKMSKTKGNGVSIEDWFKYSTPGTIRHFMFVNPTSAKKVDVMKMPAYIDAYLKDLEKFIESPDVESPIWYSEPNAKIVRSDDESAMSSCTKEVFVEGKGYGNFSDLDRTEKRSFGGLEDKKHRSEDDSQQMENIKSNIEKASLEREIEDEIDLEELRKEILDVILNAESFENSKWKQRIDERTAWITEKQEELKRNFPAFRQNNGSEKWVTESDEKKNENLSSEKDKPATFYNMNKLMKEKIISDQPNFHASLALGLLQGMRPTSLEVFLNFLEQKIQKFNKTDRQVAEAMFNFYKTHLSNKDFAVPPEWVKEYLRRFVLSEDAQQMQTDLYALGNEAVANGDTASLKDWFQELYKIFFGHDSGPRLGSFFALYGLEESRRLLARVLG